jgi:hypothetical protein
MTYTASLIAIYIITIDFYHCTTHLKMYHSLTQEMSIFTN